MSKRPRTTTDTDDDFDDEAEARDRYGDLIIDSENGSEPEPPEPRSPEPAPSRTAARQNLSDDDLDDPLRFEVYGNLFSARPINSYLQTASETPPQRPLFGPFWQENELAIFFADTGIGKSILAVQIAESIASGVAIPPFEMGCGPRRVLLFDFEMDERQIATRYSSGCGTHKYHFSDELIRIVISPDTEKPDHFRTFTHYIAESIVEHVEYYKANVVIIDNITWLTTSTRSTTDSARLMKILNHLKVTYGLSMLILAHTPKRYGASPLSVNDLFGSKMLSNFADSIFAMGASRSGPNVRYLKQLKSRVAQRKYDENSVFTMNLAKMPGVAPDAPAAFRAKHQSVPPVVAGGFRHTSSPPYQGGVAAALGGRGGSLPATEPTETTEAGKNSRTTAPISPSPCLPVSPSFLGFTHIGTDPERDHIGWYGTRFDPSRVEKLYKAHVLHAEGKSQRQIAQTLGLSLTTINRYISQTKSYENPEKSG